MGSQDMAFHGIFKCACAQSEKIDEKTVKTGESTVTTLVNTVTDTLFSQFIWCDSFQVMRKSLEIGSKAFSIA